jgi:hypothetical protein
MSLDEVNDCHAMQWKALHLATIKVDLLPPPCFGINFAEKYLFYYGIVLSAQKIK